MGLETRVRQRLAGAVGEDERIGVGADETV